MNLKLRLKNKATLAAVVAAAVAFLYQLAGILGIVPPISQEALMQALGALINLLAILGILVDPTTAGVKDSQQALEYDRPRSDKELPFTYWEDLPEEIRGRFEEEPSIEITTEDDELVASISENDVILKDGYKIGGDESHG